MKNFIQIFSHDDMKPVFTRKRKKYELWVDFLKTLLILSACTAGGFLFMHIGYSEANIVSLYILGVLLISSITSLWVYGILSSVIGIFLFNSIFAEPRFNFLIYDRQYTVILILMMLSSIAVSLFMMRFRYHAEQESLQLERAEALLETSQRLQNTDTVPDILRVASEQLQSIFGRNVICYPIEDGECLPPFFTAEKEQRPFDDEKLTDYVKERYRENLNFRFQERGIKILFFVLYANSEPRCILGIIMDSQEYLSKSERSLMLAIFDEIVLTLEKNILYHLNLQIAREAESERLRSSLLRTISHDLRTPLTGISGNADILLKNSENLSETAKKALYENIYDDADWLINMVENLLFVTRLENGNMSIHLEPEFVQDVIQSVMPQLNRHKKEHTITVDVKDDMLTAMVDAPLISQVIINIVDNAFKYTPRDSKIHISAFEQGDMAVIEIADTGPGIKEKEKVFEMFFTSGKIQPDGRRGIGLGLSSCRSIVQAHGGDIYIKDNSPHGTIVGFTLQLEKVTIK